MEHRRPDDHLPTLADLAGDIESQQLPVTHLGVEYFVTQSALRHWQITRLCDRLRERYPDGRPDREAS
jgi:hypothetical protein